VSACSRFLAVTVASAFVATASPAWADAESDAKDLFQRGRELRNKGDCAAASPLFYKAWRTYPQGLGNLRNYAECEEQLGHFASSRRAWLDIKRTLLTAPDEAKYGGWDKDAEDAAARLKPKVATVIVDVTVKTPDHEGPANDKSGVELLINGEPVAANLIGTPLERDPGVYTVRLQAPDAQPVEQGVSLAAGDNKRMSLRIVRTPKAGGNSNGAIDNGYPPDEGQGSGQKTIGWISVGVGAAALIGSGVTFLLRGSAKDDLVAACGSEDTCPQSKSKERQDAIDKGKLMGTLSPILLGVGVVGVGVGVALIVTAPNGSKERGGLTIYPGLGRVDATWRF